MGKKLITWLDNGRPLSLLYDDIYFSGEDWITESNAVFLDGVGAPEIWQGMTEFTICELGFGTGLNFLNTMARWLETTGSDQKLLYYATEKHPLSRDQIEKAICFPKLIKQRDMLLTSYPDREINFYKGRVSLKLLIGDSLEQLKKTEFKADAWYLDGFAPSKNPDMWSDPLLKSIADHSNEGAALATFTAAGRVRRELMDVGFDVSKRPGFGNKREMITANFKELPS